MNGKMRATVGLINLLAFVCTFVGNTINGELLPENVPLSQSVSINPLMPNDEQSVGDCPYTNFPYAKRGLASSIFAEQYRNKTFAHVVKLDTVDESSCVGAIIDQSHILTTKQCALKEPQTISFQNESLPRWGILNTKYHLSLDVAILQLKTNLSIDKQITPACLWTDSTSNGFSRVQHVSRVADVETGGLTISSTDCKIGERGQCFESAKRVSDGFLQVQAVSNYRQHPFLVTLGSDADGSMLEVSRYSEWIQTETGSSVDPIDCAVRYYRFREYDDRVTVHRDKDHQSIQLMKAYVSSSVNDGYKVSIGHYVEDPVKETVVNYSCYGTLIHRQFVLTTASCIDSFKNESLIVQMNQGSKYRLSSDPQFLLRAQNQYLEQVTVAEVFLHPKYSSSPLQDDLALLLLDPVELKFDSNFMPACLWAYDSTKIEAFQTNGHGPQRTVESLEERVELLLQDRSETELYLISKILKDCPLNLSRNQMCVGEVGTLVPGTCKSNLGSAMSRSIGVFHSFYDYVFAINSKGEECGINAPSTFTKVAPYVKWIDSIIFGENVKFNNSDIHYGDECRLQSGSNGVCLTVEECPGIVDDLMTGDDADLEQCGFMKGDIMVCCSTVDSAPSGLAGTQLNDVVEEIEQCPELYSDLRKGRSPYSFWKGEVTFLGLVHSNSSSNTCDATLVAKNFVITSASCYNRFPQNEQFSVKIGSTNVQHCDVEKAMVHPLYEENSHENNLAVLKLKTAVVINQELIPACLWGKRSHIPFALEVVGTMKNEVFKVQSYPLYQKRCEEQRFSNLTSTELCAVHEGYRDKDNSMICHDGGSGIYNYYAHGLHESQVAYLVGIYTRGTDCEDNAVGIFTRISHHFGWIKSVIYRNA